MLLKFECGKFTTTQISKKIKQKVLFETDFVEMLQLLNDVNYINEVALFLNFTWKYY